MDEPLSNLDAKQRVTMRSEITQIHRETGATTIYVTHDQTEAMTMADRIVVMKDGYVQQIVGGRVKEYEGKEIVFGFRPESIRLGEAEKSYVLDADVELTEMLGDNTNVYIRMGELQSILKVDPHDTPETDSSIEFSVPYENVYLFDAVTENVIE